MDVHCLTDKGMDIRPEKMFRDCVVKNVVDGKTLKAVSYTHLTLPTIYSV